MTIPWSFSYNSFLKIHSKIIVSHNISGWYPLHPLVNIKKLHVILQMIGITTINKKLKSILVLGCADISFLKEKGSRVDIQGGGAGGLDPPGKLQVAIGFIRNRGMDPTQAICFSRLVYM